VLPELFKGIALFSPGGDIVYCIDPSKQGHWHLNLCAALQEALGLSEPPHFLVPAYTATIDRWFDPQSRQIKTIAEVYPAVQRYQSLLNAIFETNNLQWQTASWQDEFCNPFVLETYRDQFPQLWETHNLIMKYHPLDYLNPSFPDIAPDSDNYYPPQNYVLRLFVSGNNATTKQTLKTIHQLLEKELRYPYSLKVIDVSQYPEQAEINQVSAIPTLVRVWPQPVRRIVGELEDLPRILQILAN
jgi:circadian clock protein KaiB